MLFGDYQRSLTLQLNCGIERFPEDAPSYIQSSIIDLTRDASKWKPLSHFANENEPIDGNVLAIYNDSTKAEVTVKNRDGVSLDVPGLCVVRWKERPRELTQHFVTLENFTRFLEFDRRDQRNLRFKRKERERYSNTPYLQLGLVNEAQRIDKLQVLDNAIYNLVNSTRVFHRPAQINDLYPDGSRIQDISTLGNNFVFKNCLTNVRLSTFLSLHEHPPLPTVTPCHAWMCVQLSVLPTFTPSRAWVTRVCT